MSPSGVVKCRKVFSATEIGINDVSDWAITLSPGAVCAQKRSGPELIVYMLATKTTFQFAIDADGAKMQPDGPLLVWRKGSTLHVLDTRTQKETRKYHFNNGYYYWQWMNSHSVGFVDKNWDVWSWKPADVQSQPEKIMTTFPPISSRGLMCRSSENGCLWLVYSGPPYGQEVQKGITLLHFKELGLGRVVWEHATVFGTSKRGGVHRDLMIAASREGDEIILKIDELDTKSGATTHSVKASISTKSAEDRPEKIRFDGVLGLVLIVMCTGWVSIHDVYSGAQLHAQKLPQEFYDKGKMMRFQPSYGKNFVCRSKSGDFHELWVDQIELYGTGSGNTM